MKSSSVQILILELLREGQAHFSAKEVYDHLKPRLPSVSPSTVYRALERLADAGEISVSDMGTGSVVFEMVGNSPHHHLVCQGCSRVITLDNEFVQPLFDRVEENYNYELTTNHLILFGYCPACSEDHD